MELRHKTETVVRVDYSDLDEFLTERFGLPDTYEVVAIEELNNDTIKSINVNRERIGSYSQKYIDAVVKDKKPKLYGTGTILCHLCNLGEIPEGEYLIDISW